MATEIEKLNAKLNKYHGGHRNVDEELFNLGVKLGRLLEQQKIEDFRLAYFVNQEVANNLQSAKQILIDEIERILLGLLTMAIKEQISLYDSVSFDADWTTRRTTKLKDDIVNTFCLQIDDVSQQEVDGDLQVTFMTSGELSKILKKHKVVDKFAATLCNDNGGDGCTIHNENKVEDAFEYASIRLHAHDKKLKIDRLKAISNDLTGFYTFFVLKYS